jgi:hypothetical protein
MKLTVVIIKKHLLDVMSNLVWNIEIKARKHTDYIGKKRSNGCKTMLTMEQEEKLQKTEEQIIN